VYTNIVYLATYDKDGAMLKKLFSEVSENLTEKGTFLLIYSDMACNLGMTPVDHIEQLCKDNQLRINNKYVSAVSSTFPADVENDVLGVIDKFKQNSRVFIYMISKNINNN
jgi:ABC-type uncharacterized transport system substrate-binding protein